VKFGQWKSPAGSLSRAEQKLEGICQNGLIIAHVHVDDVDSEFELSH